MSKIFWSAKSEAFFLEADYGEYSAANKSFPADSVEISSADYKKFADAEQEGKGVYPDKKGKPRIEERKYFRSDLQRMLEESKRLNLNQTDWIFLPDANLTDECIAEMKMHRAFWKKADSIWADMADTDRKTLPKFPDFPKVAKKDKNA